MIWRVSNILSSIIAGLLANNKTNAILLKRSIFIALNRFFYKLSVFVVVFSGFCSVYLAFHFYLIENFAKHITKKTVILLENTHLFSHKKQITTNIEINDLAIVNTADVNAVIAKYTANKSLLFIDIESVFKELQNLDFVDKVYIKRSFPHTLKIVIFERKINFVIKAKSAENNQENQGNQDTYIIDNNFAVEQIDAKNNPPKFLQKIPSITVDCIYNNEIEAAIKQMQKTLLNFDDLYTNTSSLNFVNCRSWVINLQNGNIVLLEDGAEAKSLYKYNTNKNQINALGEKNRIDLRFDGKIYIKPLDNNSIQKINTNQNEPTNIS